MTIPLERHRALNYVRDFLYDLMLPSATPKIPLSIRRRARALVKHYPSTFELEEIAKKTELLETDPSYKPISQLDRIIERAQEKNEDKHVDKIRVRRQRNRNPR
jgi:hypothetical protein